MSHDSFEVLSNQAVAACAVVYFLAVLSHLAQWAVGRKAPVTASATTSVGNAASQGGMLVRTAPPPSSADSERMELFARVGVALTIVAAFVHGIAVVSRGLAANPVRVPWGNMYEFTLTGTWFVVMGYLVLYRRYRLGWLAPVVTSFVLV
ncbi:MAG: c-type cytochrome biogenesis protein CcsB, partial [Actinomycetota bacterium]|nr:c-type cytochrome biogenesis protein CcsB [Actinomycetota bacterium]